MAFFRILRSIPLFLFFLLLINPGISRADAVSDLIDLPASKWREDNPIVSRMQKHSGSKPLRITVHYTDVPKNFDRPLIQKLRTLFDYAIHTIEGTKKKLWGDIPYHYFIDANGLLGEARYPAYMPDSNTSYDRDGHITIVIEGDIHDGITAPQKRKMMSLIRALQKKYRIPIGRVGVHKNFAETDCPGPAISKAILDFRHSEENAK